MQIDEGRTFSEPTAIISGIVEGMEEVGMRELFLYPFHAPMLLKQFSLTTHGHDFLHDRHNLKFEINCIQPCLTLFRFQ